MPKAPTCRRAVAALCAVVLCALAITTGGARLASAQPSAATEGAGDDENYRQKVASNPPGVSLTIRARGDRRTFEMGEIVTLELTFEGQASTELVFLSNTYDRSGRLGIDRVHVAPTHGIEDPLGDYYRSGIFGFIGGGISTPPTALRDRRTISLTVNDFVRFLQPGRYLLYAESFRLEDASAPPRATRPVTSNVVEIDVTPRMPRVAGEDLANWTALSLRHAGTEAAAQEMARRFLELPDVTNHVGSDDVALRNGLLGTPHRRLALDALRLGLSSHSGLVNQPVVEVAAFLDVMLSYPRPSDRLGADELEDGEIRRTRFFAYQCRASVYRQLALAAGLRGTPDVIARAVARFGTDEAPSHCTDVPATDVRAVLPPIFHHLTPQEQQAMLSWKWGLIAGPAMTSVLRAMLAETAAVSDEVRDVALVRLGELAPTEAYRLSRDDVLLATYRFSATALRVPDTELEAFREEITPMLLRRLRESQQADLARGLEARARGTLPLLERFGAAAALDDVLGTFQTIPSECATRITLAAYALRAAPARGAALLRSSIDDPASKCGPAMLEDLARRRPHLVPEPLVIEMLSHTDRHVAASASRALATIGGDEARQALWRRLQAWHDTWKDRADALLAPLQPFDTPIAAERGLERALRESLLRPTRWRPTVDERLKVRDLCLTEACRVEFSPFQRAPDPNPLFVTADESTGEAIYTVDAVRLRSPWAVAERVSLYPSTARVQFQARSLHSTARALALFESLRVAVAERGRQLLPDPATERSPGTVTVPR